MEHSPDLLSSLKTSCCWFRGDVPCQPHKTRGVHCVDQEGKDCEFYNPTQLKILIIKLGAVGDVIRTTPLLRRIKKDYPNSEIWWLTRSPDIVPPIVDRILPFTLESILVLQATPFIILYNLDKDPEACALAVSINAQDRYGFTLKDGKPAPQNTNADSKFLTGLFDDVSKKNIKSYPEEIFEICGFKFQGEKYVLPSWENEGRWDLPQDIPIIGLNTGCGGRWTSRLWPENYWVSLALALKREGYEPLLLGGKEEHERNLRIQKESGALYLGHFSLPEFTGLMNRCVAIVTAITMALHLAIGLKKKVVVLNNIFNRNEFELYELGEILEPGVPCSCYYSPTCPNNCMKYITPERVMGTLHKILG